MLGLLEVFIVKPFIAACLSPFHDFLPVTLTSRVECMPRRTKAHALVASLSHAFVSCFDLDLAALLRFAILVRSELDRGVQLYQI